MLHEVIETLINLLSADARLKDDVGTHSKVCQFSKTVEEEVFDYPAITFLPEAPVSSRALTVGGKSRYIRYDVTMYILIQNYSSIWDAVCRLGNVAKNIRDIILEQPHLKAGYVNSDITNYRYGVIVQGENEENPFTRVLQVNIMVEEKVNVAC